MIICENKLKRFVQALRLTILFFTCNLNIYLKIVKLSPSFLLFPLVATDVKLVVFCFSLVAIDASWQLVHLSFAALHSASNCTLGSFQRRQKTIFISLQFLMQRSLCSTYIKLIKLMSSTVRVPRKTLDYPPRAQLQYVELDLNFVRIMKYNVLPCFAVCICIYQCADNVPILRLRKKSSALQVHKS